MSNGVVVLDITYRSGKTDRIMYDRIHAAITAANVLVKSTNVDKVSLTTTFYSAEINGGMR